MSLVVWLPLTKDLRQQGLSDVEVTNNGAVFNSAGKLGGCYEFTSSGNNLSIPANAMNNFVAANGCSLAFWIKVNNWYSSYATFFQAGMGSTAWTHYIFGILRNATNSTVCFTISNGSSASNANYLTSAWTTGEWMHVAFTYETGKCKIYLNGSLDKEYTTSIVPDFSKITKITIGRCNNDSHYQTNCDMNDIRIYNHCLSPMEVKQISQGLVLHYPLNREGWGQENLATQYVVPGSNGPLVTTTSSGRTTYYGKYGIIIPATENADTYFSIYLKQALESGKTYTLSCRVSGLLSGTYYNFPLFAQGNSSMGLLKLDHNGLCSLTFTMNYTGTVATSTVNGVTLYRLFMDDTSRTITSGQGAITITNIKLEEGEKATPWCPATTDSLYSLLSLNEMTVYDCSGFCNNGEYYAYDTNGSITYTSDTPKYSVSTHIASANPTQNAASGTRYLYGHCELANPTQMSVAFWLKPITGGYGGTTSNGQGYFCTTNYEYGSSSVGSDYQSSAMNHRDGAVNMNDSTSTTQCNVSFYPTIGEWHHYVYTYDGQIGKGYKDGVQTTTAQFSTAKILDSFIGVVIGFSKAGGVWRRNDACYSDFRIYATALSANDVHALYENSAYIDNSGNTYAATYTEV